MTKKEEIAQVSPKSTKDQILAAYNQVVAELEKKAMSNPIEEKKEKEKVEVLKKVAKFSSENILSDLTSVKLGAIKTVDSLSEQLLGEFEKLAALQESISLEQNRLNDLYQINETANTLAALIKTHSDQKEQFETWIANKKAEWVKENERLTKEFDETKQKLEDKRKREEDEYEYKLGLARRKEMDDYNTQKILSEKELAKREADLALREVEVANKEQLHKDLQARVDNIQEEMSNAVAVAESALRASLEKEYQFAAKLVQGEVESRAKLSDQVIGSLETKIKEQNVLIKELMEKSNAAIKQVEAIACKALESSMVGRYNMNGERDKVI